MRNTEIAEKDLLQKPKYIAKIISIISSVVLVLAIVSSIILGLNLPRTKRILSEDSGRITSIAEIGADDWYYSTSVGNIYHMDEKDNVLQTFPLKEKAKELGIEDCGEIRSFFSDKNSRYIYISTSNAYLFQLD